MPKRDWCFILAIWLIAFPALGQDKQPVQDQAESKGHEDRGQQYAPNFRLPVIILETPEQAESAGKEREKSQKHDADDLVAQQSVADSTKIIVHFTKLQFILALIGAAALLYSLWLNRKATSAAVAGNANAIAAIKLEQANSHRALRAYISYSNITVTARPFTAAHDSSIAGYDFAFHFKNSGSTPAHRVVGAMGHGTAPKSELNVKTVVPECIFDPSDAPAYLGPGEVSGIESIFIGTEKFIAAESADEVKTIAAAVRYLDAFEVEREYAVCLAIKVMVDIRNLSMRGQDPIRLFNSIVVGARNGGN